MPPKKVRESRPIRFIKCLKNVFNFQDPCIGGLELTPDALSCMDILLNGVAIDLTNETALAFRRSKKDDIVKPHHVERAVHKTFKKVLAQHAMAEGNKAVFKFTNGMLKYREKKPSALRYRSKKLVYKGIPGHEYISGLKKLLLTIHGDAILTPDGAKLLSQIMDSLTNFFIGEAVAKAKQSGIYVNEMTINDIIGRIFSPTMANHARSEGLKSLALHSEGLIKYKTDFDKPKKRKKAYMLKISETTMNETLPHKKRNSGQRAKSSHTRGRSVKTITKEKKRRQKSKKRSSRHGAKSSRTRGRPVKTITKEKKRRQKSKKRSSRHGAKSSRTRGRSVKTITKEKKRRQKSLGRSIKRVQSKHSRTKSKSGKKSKPKKAKK